MVDAETFYFTCIDRETRKVYKLSKGEWMKLKVILVKKKRYVVKN